MRAGWREAGGAAGLVAAWMLLFAALAAPWMPSWGLGLGVVAVTLAVALNREVVWRRFLRERPEGRAPGDTPRFRRTALIDPLTVIVLSAVVAVVAVVAAIFDAMQPAVPIPLMSPGGGLGSVVDQSSLGIDLGLALLFVVLCAGIAAFAYSSWDSPWKPTRGALRWAQLTFGARRQAWIVLAVAEEPDEGPEACDEPAAAQRPAVVIDESDDPFSDDPIE